MCGLRANHVPQLTLWVKSYRQWKMDHLKIYFRLLQFFFVGIIQVSGSWPTLAQFDVWKIQIDFGMSQALCASESQLGHLLPLSSRIVLMFQTNLDEHGSRIMMIF